MWNTKDLQNSISKQILTLCCQLVVFWNYLSRSQPWNAFEKSVVCSPRWNYWACSAYQARWERPLSWTAVWCKRQSFVQPRPQNRLLQNEQLKQFESISRRSDSDSLPNDTADVQKCGLREEDGTSLTALRTPLAAIPPHIRCALHLRTVTLHFCDCTHSC